jgi:orotate phosphoribosyltransferase
MRKGTLRPVSGSGTAVAVARALLDAGCVSIRPEAPVTFTSGLRSPVYVDNRQLISHPGPWRVAIESLAAAIRMQAPPVEVVAGIEASGIPHSSAVGYTAGLPTVFVRKEVREHGLGRRIEGGEVEGRRVVLVEDMVTTGGSSLAAVQALRDAGADASDCLAIISYGFAEAVAAFEDAGVGLSVLTTFETVLNEAVEARHVTAEAAQVVRDWLADPHGWVA